MSIQSLRTSCDDPLCSERGYHGRACCPEKYRWVMDRLIEEFGVKAVRLGWVGDYGWRQDIGVEVPDGRRGLSVPLQASYDDGEFDLCEHPEVLDALVERVRAASRGFGQ